MTSRLPIVLSLSNKYDYAEFLLACESAGIEPMPWIHYAQKVEHLIAAMDKYPDMQPMDAYMKLIKDNENHLVFKAEESKPTEVARKSCCGGGRVR